MSINQYWLIDEYVYVIEFTSPVMEEIKLLNIQMLELLNACQHPTYTFLDATSLKSFPTNFIELRSHAEYIKHPNMKLLVGIGLGQNPLTVTLAQLIAGIMGVKVFHESSIEKALEAIYRDNPSLRNAKVNQ
jgi:hypothetical protein